MRTGWGQFEEGRYCLDWTTDVYAGFLFLGHEENSESFIIQPFPHLGGN